MYTRQTDQRLEERRWVDFGGWGWTGEGGEEGWRGEGTPI